MSDSLNKIPVSPITSFGNPSVPNGSTFGTNFSILQTGGYMEVYTLSGLTYTILSTPGINEYSGNSIPIQFTKGSGSVFSPDVLTLNSDNISSGRRKLGMLVYVYETDKIYQFNIKNYDTLWSNATGATGPGGPTVVMSDYGTTVKNNSAAGIALINAWTTSTISGVNGYNDTNASWAILQTQSITGGTYFQGNTTFTNSTGGTFNIFGPSNYDPGVISGETWTDNSNGSINLPQITVALFNNPNFFEPLKFYSIPSGTTGVGSIPALLNNDTNYVIVEYNNGSPRYNVLDNDGTVDWSSVILYMIIYRADNFVHILEFGNMGSGLSSKMNDRIISTDRFARESGCSLGLSGSTGVVTLSSGVVWNGPNRQIVNGVTSMGLFFKNYHSGGTWVYTTTAHTINNLYYDNGTDLVLATGGKYLVNWYFRGQELNDHLYEVVSSNQYDSVLGAEASNEPNLPELIISHAFLVGRIIIAVSATTGITQSAFTNVFQPSGASGIHNDLIGLQGGLPNEYYHLDSNKYNNLALTNTNNNFSVGQTFLSGLTATTITANNISGTTNYVSKFTGANSLGNSLIYDNGTNVGIGTTSPTGKLDVLGIATSSPSATVTAGDLVVDTANRTVYIGKQSNTSSDNTSFIFRDRLGARKSYWENASSGNISFGNFGTNYGVSIATSTLSFGVTSPARLVVDSGLSTFPSAVFTTGNVGIGTTSPTYKLSVSALTTTDGIEVNNGGSSRVILRGDGVVLWGASADAGRLTWDTNKATIVGQSGKSLSLGANGNADYVFINTSGNVGIGTTSPDFKLDVVSADGTIANRRDTNTATFGSNIASYLKNSANVWTRYGDSGGGIISNVAGSEAGMFTIRTMKAGTITESVRVDDNGDVGIGTTNPNEKLHVYGTSVGINIDGTTAARTYYNRNGSYIWSTGLRAGDTKFHIYDERSTDRFVIDDSGNVGIGITSPTAKLQVSGSTQVGLSSINAGSYTNGLAYVNPSGTATSLFLFQAGVASGHVGFRASDNNLYIVNSYTNGSVTNSAAIALTSTGNVGIGTTSPIAKLDVQGSITAVTNLAKGVNISNNLISSANNDVLVGLDIAPNYVGGVGAFNNFAGGAGYSAGTYTNISLTGGTGTGAIATIIVVGSAVTTVTITTPGSGYYLGNILSTSGGTINGVGSGFNLTVNTLSNTSVKPIGLRVDGINIGRGGGYNSTNTVIGNLAGLNNTTGGANTFLGYLSGQFNNSGSQNTFIGQNAGGLNTSGNNNTNIGVNAGFANTTGVANVFLGRDAGRFITDKSTPATSVDRSIMLGYRTSPLGDSQTNQIVIGYDSTGLGSNTTVLGNSSTITTAIYGDLLLGTTIDSGTEKLQVQGTAGMTAVKIIGSGNSTTPPIFTVQGSQGELFSVNDSLTGSLFSVNDISGLPILEVFSDNTVLMGSYIAPSLNTTTKVTAGVGLTSVYSIPTSAYTGAFFDYTISDNTNLRAGNVMAIWNSGTTVQYTETSTNDIGNTSGLTFNMIISGSTAILRTSGVTGNWTVKTIIRSI